MDSSAGYDYYGCGRYYFGGKKALLICFGMMTVPFIGENRYFIGENRGFIGENPSFIGGNNFLSAKILRYRRNRRFISGHGPSIYRGNKGFQFILFEM